MRNLAAESPEQTKEFRRTLRAWVEEADRKRPSEAAKVTLDEETAARLRALGYLPPSEEAP